jgi:hypothetical protein
MPSALGSGIIVVDESSLQLTIRSRKRSFLNMSDNPVNNPDHDALYAIPLDVLNLSDKALKALAREEITSVGGCVDLLIRWHKTTLNVPFALLNAIYVEARPRLIELGYWNEEDG